MLRKLIGGLAGLLFGLAGLWSSSAVAFDEAQPASRSNRPDTKERLL